METIPVSAVRIGSAVQRWFLVSAAVCTATAMAAPKIGDVDDVASERLQPSASFALLAAPLLVEEPASPRRSRVSTRFGVQLFGSLIGSAAAGGAAGAIGGLICPKSKDAGFCLPGLFYGYAIGAVIGASIGTSLSANSLHWPPLLSSTLSSSALATGVATIAVILARGGILPFVIWFAAPIVGAIAGYHIGLALTCADTVIQQEPKAPVRANALERSGSRLMAVGLSF